MYTTAVFKYLLFIHDKAILKSSLSSFTVPLQR